LVIPLNPELTGEGYGVRGEKRAKDKATKSRKGQDYGVERSGTEWNGGGDLGAFS